MEVLMTQAILSLKHWGNNLGVRLPQAVAREAHLHADQQVRVSVEAGRVVIEPLPTAPLSLEDRLKRFDPERHAGEVMATAPIGAEKW
jgi:antitoxin MazE